MSIVVVGLGLGQSRPSRSEYDDVSPQSRSRGTPRIAGRIMTELLSGSGLESLRKKPERCGPSVLPSPHVGGERTAKHWGDELLSGLSGPCRRVADEGHMPGTSVRKLAKDVCEVGCR